MEGATKELLDDSQKQEAFIVEQSLMSDSYERDGTAVSERLSRTKLRTNWLDLCPDNSDEILPARD